MTFAVVFLVALVTLILGLAIAYPRPFQGYIPTVCFMLLLISGTVLAVRAL